MTTTRHQKTQTYYFNSLVSIVTAVLTIWRERQRSVEVYFYFLSFWCSRHWQICERYDNRTTFLSFNLLHMRLVHADWTAKYIIFNVDGLEIRRVTKCRLDERSCLDVLIKMTLIGVRQRTTMKIDGARDKGDVQAASEVLVSRTPRVLTCLEWMYRKVQMEKDIWEQQSNPGLTEKWS